MGCKYFLGAVKGCRVTEWNCLVKLIRGDKRIDPLASNTELED